MQAAVRIWKATRGHPLLSAGALIGFITAGVGLVGDAQTGADIMQFVFGADWLAKLSAVVSSPWFGVAALLMGSACLRRIATLAERGEKDAASIRASALHTELADVRELLVAATKLPNLIAARFVAEKDNMERGAALAHAAQYLETYRSSVEAAKSTCIDLIRVPPDQRDHRISSGMAGSLFNSRQSLTVAIEVLGGRTGHFANIPPPPTGYPLHNEDMALLNGWIDKLDNDIAAISYELNCQRLASLAKDNTVGRLTGEIEQELSRAEGN